MLGTPELILILVILILLFIAPRHITDMARSLGEGIRTFREETKGIGVEPSEQPIIVFVSSMINELSNERQAIRQAIQQIPLTKPWLFEFTPPSSENVDDSYLNKVKDCDIFLLIVGTSISLPVIHEFELANTIHKPCLIFLKDCDRTEEAQSFVASIPFKWANFSTTEELINLAQLSLIDELIRGYREGWQKKLTTEHLTVLISIQELLRAKESEKVIREKEPAIKGATSSPQSTTKLLDFEAFRSAGEKYLNQRDFGNAVKFYTKAIFLEPGSAQAFLGRGHSYSNLNKTELAAWDYEKAISLSPDEFYKAECYRSLATLYIDSDDSDKYDKCVAACDQALIIDAEGISAHLNKGKALLYLSKESEQGKEHLRNAIRLSSEQIKHSPSAKLLGWRADAYYTLSDPKNAISDCQRALELKPNEPAYYLLLGLCYHHLGQKADAEKAFDRCISLGESYWSSHATRARNELKKSRPT